MFAAREGGNVVVASGGLLKYEGSARIMEPEAKLTDFLPMSAGSVVRSIGQVGFEGCTFDGSERDPLGFGFVERVGFVHLRGSGSVKLQNGQARQLGAR
jgi:hypothetical protein